MRSFPWAYRPASERRLDSLRALVYRADELGAVSHVPGVAFKIVLFFIIMVLIKKN